MLSHPCLVFWVVLASNAFVCVDYDSERYLLFCTSEYLVIKVELSLFCGGRFSWGVSLGSKLCRSHFHKKQKRFDVRLLLFSLSHFRLMFRSECVWKVFVFCSVLFMPSYNSLSDSLLVTVNGDHSWTRMRCIYLPRKEHKSQE